MFGSWVITILALCPLLCLCPYSCHSSDTWVRVLWSIIFCFYMLLCITCSCFWGKIRFETLWCHFLDTQMRFFFSIFFSLDCLLCFSPLFCSIYQSVFVCLSVHQYACPCAFLSISQNCTYTWPSVNMALNNLFFFSKNSRRAFNQRSIIHKFCPVFKCVLHPYLDTVQIQLWFVFGVYNPVLNKVSGDLYCWICVG